MQRRLSIALSLAVLLIGGATWYRIVGASDSSSSLTVINNNDDQVTYIDSPIGSTGSAGTSSGEKLNTTDLVGRQLMYDYLALASQGQATDENMNKLVSDYATNLSNIGSYKPLVSADIKMVSDTKENLQNYSSNLTRIYSKYHSLAAKTVKDAGDLSDVESKKFTSTMNELGKLYAEASHELESVLVPVSLSTEHLKLINNYISSAGAFSAIGTANTDATSAYGALSTQAENSAEETELILSIQSKLLRSGILFNAEI
jgi:hypothetical protein